MATFVALLRAVNVGGRKVPMADLKALCARLGYADVQTYVASGNLVFTAPGGAAKVQKELQAGIEARFKLEVPVVVRTADQWAAYLANPFEDGLPKLVHLALSQKAPDPGCAAALQARAAAGEKVKHVGDALWIDFADSGVARSKLTPSAIDKAVGSPTTARNWNTVRKLAGLAGVL